MFDQDRLTVVYGPEDPKFDILLVCVLKDEMYFLPEFLAHYRALGVEHFVFLDDASTDGTTVFLQLGFARTSGSNAAPLPGHALSAAQEPWQSITQLG